MTGWTANDTMSGYHYLQANSSSSLLALMDFQGAAVWVWGFCEPQDRDRSWMTLSYGSISIDSGTSTLSHPLIVRHHQ